MPKSVLTTPSLPKLSFEYEMVGFQGAPHNEIVKSRAGLDAMEQGILSEERFYQPTNSSGTDAFSPVLGCNAKIEFDTSMIGITQIERANQADLRTVLIDPKAAHLGRWTESHLACLLYRQSRTPMERPAVPRQESCDIFGISAGIDLNEPQLKQS